uniref:Uncharacterized protein n=1 Tax=viral metagenome TaxID=1070528 RepID=A0A6C0LP92_9ZZZZ
MASNQTHVNPITVKRLLRISPRATTRTSPRTPPILRLDEDSLRKVFEKYSEMVDKPKIIADKLLQVFKSNPYDTISPIERKRARNILETTDLDTLYKIWSIVETVEPRNANVVYSLKEREIFLLLLKNHNDTLETLNDKVENVKAKFKSDKKMLKFEDEEITDRVKRVDTILEKINNNLMNTKITEKYIKTLPDNISESQRIMEKNIKEKVKEIEKLLDEAMNLISLINQIIKYKNKELLRLK